MIRRLAIALWLLALPASAEDLPAPAHTSINDFAAVLTAADAQVIDEALIALHDATGIEGTVVTVPDRARYGDPSIEAFATRLFDAWGVGDAARNDGFMLLLAMAEREARIELGAGYGRSADIRAGDIMRAVMIPRLKAGDTSGALREGTLAVVAGIARPQGGKAPAQPAGGFDWIRAAVFGLFGLVALRLLGGVFGRARSCPRCGARGLHRDRASDSADSSVATRTVTMRCPACGWTGATILPVSAAADRSHDWRGGRGGGRSGGFGGGRSGGGGASGKW